MYYFFSLSKCKLKGMNMRMISVVFVLLMNSKKVKYLIWFLCSFLDL